MYVSAEERKRYMEYRNSQSGFAQLLGIRVMEIGEGFSTVELQSTSESLRNPIGAIHGGCIFSLIDIAGGAAAWSHGYQAVTASVDVHYLNPAITPQTLTADAREIKAGRRQLLYDVKVRDESGLLIAVATATYANLDKPLCIP